MTLLIDEASTRTLPELSQSRHIPGPTGEREPLKANVYERASKQAAQLVPIFPYDDAGAIVPCAAILAGGQAHGHFFHWNTVSEIVVTWGSNEAMLQTGQIMATQKFHGVNSFVKDEMDPEAYALVTVTQRQSTEAGQREAMVAKCESCKQELLRHEYASGPFGAPDFEPGRFGLADDVFRQFSTLVGSAEFEQLRNSQEGRTCPHCGHVNTVFPNRPWNWDRIVRQTEIVNAAFHKLVAAAEAGGA